MTTTSASIYCESDIYPSFDGKPMAESTLQYEWIVLIKENLERLFANDPQVFVAGDLLWYPVPAKVPIAPRQAPDVMVVIGRPKSMRKSYIQHKENNIAPQVVFEIFSDSNKTPEGTAAMQAKFNFYEQYGVAEYYIYDPAVPTLQGYQRCNQQLALISALDGWVSPHLGIKFRWQKGQELKLYFPDGEEFVNTIALANQRDQARLGEASARQMAMVEKQRADKLAELLKQMGVDLEG